MPDVVKGKVRTAVHNILYDIRLPHDADIYEHQVTVTEPGAVTIKVWTANNVPPRYFIVRVTEKM